MKYTLPVLLLIKLITAKEIVVEGLPSYFYPCRGSNVIAVSSEKLIGIGDKHFVHVNTNLRPKTNITIKFDSTATVKLINSTRIVPVLPIRKENCIFNFQTISDVTHFCIRVQSNVSGKFPYLKSVLINLQEYCEKPLMGNLDGYIENSNDIKEVRVKRESKKKKNKKKKEEEQIDQSCGRRQHLDYTELIVNGATSKPGDWPWHAALYRHNRKKLKYICGGTLIKKTFIVTAAHCVTINKVPVNPNILRVVLGKYNMAEGETYCQERDVSNVISHGEFGRPEYLDNDIALVELSTEAVYNEHVQPACMWYKKAKHKLPSEEIVGTVAGWGYDSNKSLSPQLRQITMPKIKRSDCIMKNPLFYGIMLKNEKKFCAGWGNGTSPCNGDSGGGFMVFVPDEDKDESLTSGAWYIRGIVSVAVSFKDQSMCDPNEYVVFTNSFKYKDWIKDNTDSR